MLEIRKLESKDYKKAVKFTIDGMNFKRYTENTLLLKLYAYYFLFLEMNRATHILAAYEKDELAGLLIANIKGEKKIHNNFFQQCYIKTIDFIVGIWGKDSTDKYDDVNKKMFK